MENSHSLSYLEGPVDNERNGLALFNCTDLDRSRDMVDIPSPPPSRWSR